VLGIFSYFQTLHKHFWLMHSFFWRMKFLAFTWQFMRHWSHMKIAYSTFSIVYCVSVGAGLCFTKPFARNGSSAGSSLPALRRYGATRRNQGILLSLLFYSERGIQARERGWWVQLAVCVASLTLQGNGTANSFPHHQILTEQRRTVGCCVFF
jgi:hypothetical protein